MIPFYIFLAVLGTVTAHPAKISEHILQKREVATTTLTDDIWTTTISSSTSTITPYAFDGITVSASPVDIGTKNWVSLDSSGIPYAVTPTVKNGKTTSASPTPTRTNYPTPAALPPVLRCMNERIPSYTDPFCIKNQTEFVVGETYWITWNPLYWNPHVETDDAVSKAKIKVYPYPNNDNQGTISTSDWIENANGYYAWKIKESDINSDNDGYVQLYLSPFVTDETDSPTLDSVAGPIVRIIKSKNNAQSTISRVPSDNSSNSSDDTSENSDSDSSSSGNKNKTKVIVPAVIVPIVGIFLIAAVVFTFLWKKRNKHMKSTSSKSISMNMFNKGYVGSKKERMSGASTGATASTCKEEESEHN